MRVGAETHVGRIRHSNEDAYHVAPPLIVVADGMGGHAAGEVASSLAVQTLAAWSVWTNPGQSLVAALLYANDTIVRHAKMEPACAGMGTTVTAAFAAGGRLVYAHIGDSRLYAYRAGKLTCVTLDHSVVGELQRSGGLTENEARLHPHRNMLTRVLGVSGAVDIDTGTIELQPGDRILLCTDGLTVMLTDPEIARILAAAADPGGVARELVYAANHRGGPDNITVVVADITEEDMR